MIMLNLKTPQDMLDDPDVPPGYFEMINAALKKEGSIWASSGVAPKLPAPAPHRQESGKREPMDVAVISNEVESFGIEEKSKLKLREVTLTLCSLNAMRIVLSLLFLVYARKDKTLPPIETTVA